MTTPDFAQAIQNPDRFAGCNLMDFHWKKFGEGLSADVIRLVIHWWSSAADDSLLPYSEYTGTKEGPHLLVCYQFEGIFEFAASAFNCSNGNQIASIAVCYDQSQTTCNVLQKIWRISLSGDRYLQFQAADVEFVEAIPCTNWGQPL